MKRSQNGAAGWTRFSSRPIGGVRNTPRGLFVASHLSRFHLQPRVYNFTHLQKDCNYWIVSPSPLALIETLSLIRGKASDKITDTRNAFSMYCKISFALLRNLPKGPWEFGNDWNSQSPPPFDSLCGEIHQFSHDSRIGVNSQLQSQESDRWITCMLKGWR